MEELETLTNQVKLLKESVEMMVTRSEQLFRLQEERLNVLPQLAAQLQQTIDTIETTNQALLDSLVENEEQSLSRQEEIEKIKKITAVLLLIEQRKENENVGQQQHLQNAQLAG